MRNSWTDDRLDHLNQRVDEGFKGMKDEFARVDKRIDEGFERMDVEFARVDKRFDKVEAAIAKFDDRLDSLVYVLMAGIFGLIGVVIAAATAAIIAGN